MIEVVDDHSKPVPIQLYAALVRAQAVVCGVEKASTNDYHRYRYASAEDVVSEAKRALAHAELAVFAVSWERTPAKSATSLEGEVYVEEHARVAVTYRLVHSSGEQLDFRPFEVPSIPEKGRPEDKAEATARTFALGYFLRDLLLIPRVDAAEPTEPSVDRRDDRAYEPPKRKGATSATKSPAAEFAATAASTTVTAAIESAMRTAKSEAALGVAVQMAKDAANDRRINREQYDALRATCARVRAELAKPKEQTTAANSPAGAPAEV